MDSRKLHSALSTHKVLHVQGQLGKFPLLKSDTETLFNGSVYFCNGSFGMHFINCYFIF